LFNFIFGSKNKKLVKQWSKEHQEISVLSHKILASYSKEDFETLKYHIRELRDIVINHLMIEDIEFHRILREDSKKLSEGVKKATKDFIETFRDTKTILRKFLHQYTREDVIFNDEFYTRFEKIVVVLENRILYEESNLYSQLKEH
jgi:Hemerythrin HHE cation binding domain